MLGDDIDGHVVALTWDDEIGPLGGRLYAIVHGRLQACAIVDGDLKSDDDAPFGWKLLARPLTLTHRK